MIIFVIIIVIALATLLIHDWVSYEMILIAPLFAGVAIISVLGVLRGVSNNNK